MGIEAPGYVHAAPIFELSKDRRSTDNSVEVEAALVKELNECRSTSSSSSSASSSGRNSDDVSANSSSEGEDSGGNEVQSAYNGTLDRLEATEEVLPMRRGISMFYNGKSKSFATLADASSSSIQDVVKPEKAYTRKRRNLLAFHQVWEQNRSFGGIRKKPISSSRSTLSLAVAMKSSDSSSCISEYSNSSLTSIGIVRNSPSSSPPQQKFSPWRSLSLFDLQQQQC